MANRRRDKYGRFSVDRDYCRAARRLVGGSRSNLVAQIQRLPCISGFGLGLQRTRGELTGDVSLLVGVVKKEPLASLPVSDVIPSRITLDDPVSGKRGLEINVDVIETGYLRPFGIECDRFRPAIPGASVGHRDVTTGTLGCWVIERETYEVLYLSNNHVIADSNRGSVGDTIYQPGTYCGGTNVSNRYGELHRYVELSGHANLVDAAVGRPNDSGDPKLLILGIGEPTGTIDLDDGDLGIELSGFGNRSGVHTGSTKNELLSVDFATSAIFYGSGKKADGPYYSFVEQLLLDNETKQPYIPGDSGTVYVLEDGEDVLVAGLNFAGSSTVAVGNHIRNVLDGLNVEVCVAGAASSEESAAALRTFRAEHLGATPLGKSLQRAFVRLGPAVAKAMVRNPQLAKEWAGLQVELSRAVKSGSLAPERKVPDALYRRGIAFGENLARLTKGTPSRALRNACELLKLVEGKSLKTILKKELVLPKQVRKKKP